MKLRIFFAVLLVAGAWVAGRRFMARGDGGDSGGGARGVAVSSPLSEVRAGERVINESFRLDPGARVDVSGINGPVEIETVEGDTAELHVVIHADRAGDLENSKITVERESGRLALRGHGGGGGSFLGWVTGRGGGGGRVTHSVTMKLPRRVELRASGINGDVRIGALEGVLKLSGVNGGVESAGATESADVSGVHGRVTLRLASVPGEGLKVSGVNGGVELLVAPGVNADVRVSGMMGGVDVSLPNMTVDEDRRSHFAGRIGAGGPVIKISGIHGDVRLANN